MSTNPQEFWYKFYLRNGDQVDILDNEPIDRLVSYKVRKRSPCWRGAVVRAPIGVLGPVNKIKVKKRINEWQISREMCKQGPKNGLRNLVKKDSGRAKHNSQGTAGSIFTK